MAEIKNDINKGGRPKAFNTPEELETLLNEYFDWCDEQKEINYDKKGNPIIIRKPYTISGICVYLDISKETWCEYSKKAGFSESCKRAKAKVENYVEEGSMNGKLNVVGAIFNLKNNFGWVDRQEVVNTTQPEKLSIEELEKDK